MGATSGYVFSVEDVLDCPFEDASYALYNVGGADAVRIVTTGDNMTVWRNSESTALGPISRDGVLEASSSQGDIFYACEPIFGSGSLGSFDVSLVPSYLAADTLGTTASRYGGIIIDLYSVNATSATIYRNGNTPSTVALTPGSVTTFSQIGNPYLGAWRVDADGDVIGYKRGNTGDSGAIVKPANKIVGWASTGAYIAKESGNAPPDGYRVYGHLTSISDTLSTSYDLINSPDIGSGTYSYYNPDSAMISEGGSGINLYANSRADSDGGNETAHLPLELLRQFHKLPQPSEFIAINSLTNSPIEIRSPAGSVIATLTPTKVNIDSNAPYSAYYGSPNGASSFPIGTEIYSDDPIQVVFQSKGSGGFGSDDDESNSFGYNINP